MRGRGRSKLIGITGAKDSGKTTLAVDLYKSLREKGVRCCLVGEVASSVLAEEGTYDVSVETEEKILEKQLQLERIARRLKSIVILDRTIYDWLYYFLRAYFDSSSVPVRCARIFSEVISANRYDGLIVCKPVHPEHVRPDLWVEYYVVSSIVKLTPVKKLHVSGGREERLRKAEEFVLSV